MMSFTSMPQPIIGGLLLSSPHPHSSFFHCHQNSSTIFKWGLRGYLIGSLVTSRTKSQAFQTFANPNMSPGEGDSSKKVIMVDPLEAKRLAAKQMQEIQAKKKFKRRRQIEAINGAWAMIGLTVAFVIEGHTGKSILDQLAGYWSAIFNFGAQ
ncbi:Chloroa_b-bind domain-containing protein [Cephalotus follicularis]|uniref:Chloroa_b-bind domain-containing protein n=1 Tax=Cephalotus follicularis TaxID=3775 RepID=A0A1Q3BTJ8_CEPFO|nr:Chloroa_b-bind domain-containing protein [Cephalotus follicularis]